MEISKFPNLLGLTNTELVLVDALSANGGSVEGLSPKKFKELGTDFVFLPSKGIEIAFTTRATYESDYEKAATGDGPYAVAGLFFHLHGTEQVEPYKGLAPFVEVAVTNREEALETYGAPIKTKGAAGEVVWDQWRIEGHHLRINYADDQSVITISVSYPMV